MPSAFEIGGGPVARGCQKFRWATRFSKLVVLWSTGSNTVNWFTLWNTRNSYSWWFCGPLLQKVYFYWSLNAKLSKLSWSWQHIHVSLNIFTCSCMGKIQQTGTGHHCWAWEQVLKTKMLTNVTPKSWREQRFGAAYPVLNVENQDVFTRPSLWHQHRRASCSSWKMNCGMFVVTHWMRTRHLLHAELFPAQRSSSPTITVRHAICHQCAASVATMMIF